jgi:hypothetical protein
MARQSDSLISAQVYWAAVPEWVLTSPISDRAVRLYGLLVRRANADDQCFPSRRLLAKQMSCSVASVDRALAELVDAGAIRREHQFIDGRQTVNLYTILATPAAPVMRGGRTGEEGEGCTGDAQNESHRNDSHTLATASRKRQPDLLFEALAEACRIPIDRLTATQRGRLNKAVKELREIEATPDLIADAAKRYRTMYPDATLTPQALTGNWANLRPAPRPKRPEDINWCPACLTDSDLPIHTKEYCDDIVALT